MSEASAPKRRWFRWSLLAFGVVLMASVGWLGNQINWIRQRHAALATDGVSVDTLQDDDPFGDPVEKPPAVVSPPGLLWVFGESGYAGLSVRCSGSDYAPSPSEMLEIERLGKLFPESVIGLYWVEEPEPPPPPRPEKKPGSDFDGFQSAQSRQ